MAYQNNDNVVGTVMEVLRAYPNNPQASAGCIGCIDNPVHCLFRLPCPQSTRSVSGRRGVIRRDSK